MKKRNKIIYGIFTKPVHVEKLVNYLNKYTDISYIIGTRKDESHRDDFDIGVSYCFPYIIDVIDDKRPWFNYHPAPLPEYPGILNYIQAVNDKVVRYGNTLHRVNTYIDKGEIIKIRMFNLDSIPISVSELGCITHYYLFQLFKDTITDLEKIMKV